MSIWELSVPKNGTSMELQEFFRIWTSKKDTLESRLERAGLNTISTVFVLEAISVNTTLRIVLDGTSKIVFHGINPFNTAPKQENTFILEIHAKKDTINGLDLENLNPFGVLHSAVLEVRTIGVSISGLTQRADRVRVLRTIYCKEGDSLSVWTEIST